MSFYTMYWGGGPDRFPELILNLQNDTTILLDGSWPDTGGRAFQGSHIRQLAFLPVIALL